jgi:hypothetical protein
LDDLIQYLTSQTDADIDLAKTVLHDANMKVVSLEKRLTSDYRKDLGEKLRLKQADLNAHNEAKPKLPPSEGGEEATKGAAQIKIIDDQLEQLQRKSGEYQVESTTVARTAEDLRQARQTIERQVTALAGLKVKFETLFTKEGLRFDDVVSVAVSYQGLDDIIKARRTRLEELDELLRTDGEITALGLTQQEEGAARDKSLFCQHNVLTKSRLEITDNLDKPNREYQAYLIALTQWQTRQKALEGDVENPAVDTYNWVKQENQAVTTTLPDELETARQARAIASHNVLAKKKSVITFYEAVKRSIDEEISKMGIHLTQVTTIGSVATHGRNGGRLSPDSCGTRISV